MVTPISIKLSSSGTSIFVLQKRDTQFLGLFVTLLYFVLKLAQSHPRKNGSLTRGVRKWGLTELCFFFFLVGWKSNNCEIGNMEYGLLKKQKVEKGCLHHKH